MIKKTFTYKAVYSLTVIVVLFSVLCLFTHLALNTFSGSYAAIFYILGMVCGFVCGWTIGDLAAEIYYKLKEK